MRHLPLFIIGQFASEASIYYSCWLLFSSVRISGRNLEWIHQVASTGTNKNSPSFLGMGNAASLFRGMFFKFPNMQGYWVILAASLFI
jgi:hypothetical protein